MQEKEGAFREGKRETIEKERVMKNSNEVERVFRAKTKLENCKTLA